MTQESFTARETADKIWETISPTCGDVIKDWIYAEASERLNTLGPENDLNLDQSMGILLEMAWKRGCMDAMTFMKDGLLTKVSIQNN